MKPRVYVETSVVSYMAARPSRDATKSARQLQARAFWNAQNRFTFVVSPVVLDEAARGNAGQAAKRLSLLNGLTQLNLSPETDYLAQLLIERNALPAQAVADAAHIAIATVHKTMAIVSFNFRHIAGAFARRNIEMTLRQLGYEPPVIATPEEILGGFDE
jgi:predicted nucleic acid-binding protein